MPTQTKIKIDDAVELRQKWMEFMTLLHKQYWQNGRYF